MDKEKWYPAYKKEYDAQMKRVTWELTELPPGRVAP